MKKLFLTLVLAFTGIFAANAQFWMGGSTSVYASENLTTFSIAPEIGYTFNKFTIASGVSYDLKHTGKKRNSHSVIISPYVRYSVYTFKNHEGIDKFGLFLDLTGDFDVTSDKFGYRVGLQPGIAWMATKHWTAAFRFAFLGYNHCDHYLTEAEPDYGFKFGLALAAPTFGLYYNF